MNQVLAQQNDKELIKLLKASKVAYANSKRIENITTLFLLMLALVYPVYFVYSSNEDVKLVLFGCTFLIAFLVQVFSGHLKGNTHRGALFKEEFDVALFNLPWKSTLKRPDKAELIHYSKKYRGAPLKNWYPPHISANIAADKTIAICQRINSGWDISLRKKYSVALKTVLIIYTLTLCGFFVVKSVDARTIFAVFFSVLSFYTHFLAILRGHQVVISKREKIRDRLDEMISGTLPINEQALRDIQDEIYLTRQEPAKVPDFFFWLYKKKFNAEYRFFIDCINKGRYGCDQA